MECSSLHSTTALLTIISQLVGLFVCFLAITGISLSSFPFWFPFQSISLHSTLHSISFHSISTDLRRRGEKSSVHGLCGGAGQQLLVGWAKQSEINRQRERELKSGKVSSRTLAAQDRLSLFVISHLLTSFLITFLFHTESN